MFINRCNILALIFASLILFFLTEINVEAKYSASIKLDDTTKRLNMYPAIDIIKDRNREVSIDDIVFGKSANKFIPIEEVEQKKGFFETGNWLRFEINNQSNQKEWMLEFAFPLIHEIEIYEENNSIELLYKTGADFIFQERDVKHRYFVFNLDIDPGETKVFYALAVGSGDLHPPISIWDKDEYIIKSQKELILLGLFYGVILVMIIYNLFLYFSLRLKSYLYYVITITFTLLGKISINGIGFQYIWPNYPGWNLISAPIWVSLACVFILVFTRNFLDIERYTPSFKTFLFILIPLNICVIIFLAISRYIALYMMVIAALATFLTVLIFAIIALRRGARQARFYIIGWLVFLTGVSITILERAVILPFTFVTEYAGQFSLTVEVVLLSLALADKINIMRQEKMLAEQRFAESQELALKNLQKSDQLKDEFLAITSHELRTPLYGMIGISESLRDGIAGETTEEMKNQLSMVITSGRRLTHLVDEILDFSKLKYDSLDLQLKSIEIYRIIEIVLAMTMPLLKDKSITIMNHTDDSLAPVLADENRLQQIFYNLIDNAIKYTDEGQIIIRSTSNKDTITIHITNPGYGISKEQLAVIFEPFQQGSESLSRKVDGLGIGLNITKQLVDLHHGTLHVSSEPGKTTTFSVTLLADTENHKKREHTYSMIKNIPQNQVETLQHPQITKENSPKILVADDELVNLQVLMNHLSLKGYEVLTVLRGEEVFQLIEENDIDLLILDIMMPGMSGYEVCQKLRTTYSLMELPILMLTAKNQVQDKMISFEAGANDYLVKPCDKQELLSRVKTLVRIKTLNQELIQVNYHLEEKVLERTHDLEVANEDLKDMAASRSQLLADIAHELGTPVTLIHHYMQSIQKGLISIDDLHYNHLVEDKIKLMNRLIDDLFDLSILESDQISFNIKEISVDQLMKRIINNCEFAVLQTGRQFEVENDLQHVRHLKCFVDEERMDQLFSNLISNAIKHTQSQTGKISMKIKLSLADQLIIEVSDNGVGIRKEDLDFIFDRFYKRSVSSNKQLGTGLGLAIAKEIIHNHKGDVVAKSIENEGTTFYITLPSEFHNYHHRHFEETYR